jgi:hypothetical protein
MKDVIYVRNPQTGLLDVKEFAAESTLQLLRIADPVSTALVQGFDYKKAGLIGNELFTPVRMPKETGRFPAFGKEVFVIPTNLKRDIGGRVQRILTQTGYVTMSLSEYALGVGLDNRERNEWAGAPDMLLNGKLNQVAGKIAGLREKNQAVLATTNGSYLSGLSTSGASKKWATTGDAVKDMLDLILLVQQYNGQRPNKVWFSPAAWALWRRNVSVIDLMKYQGTSAAPAKVTAVGTAELLEVSEVLIGYAVVGTPSAPGSDGGVNKSAVTMSYLWDSVQSANAGCAIVGSGGGIEPAFGYTWERMNSPVVESYYENQTKSQIWDYEHFFDAAVTLNSAGGQYYSLA